MHRLKAPTALRERVNILIRNHMTRLEEDKKLLKRRVRSLGWEAVEQLLRLQEADMGSKGTGEDNGSAVFAEVRQLLADLKTEDACLNLKALAVNGNESQLRGRSCVIQRF